MTPAEWAELVPLIAACLAALTAWLKAEAADRSATAAAQAHAKIAAQIAQHGQGDAAGKLQQGREV